METLITIHSLLRWFVLLALVGSAGLAFSRLRSPLLAGDDRPFSISAIVMDLQVTLGIVIWIFDSGWSKNLFLAVIHPVFMLAALGVFHALLARARRFQSHRMMAIGAVASLVLVLAAIPWAS